MLRSLVRIYLFVFFILLYTSGYATITISSVTTTTSSCGNDGTATVNAVSNKTNPFLLYEIIAGPATSPVQSSSTFFSLFPGTYTVRVYDVDFESLDRQFTVSGNYQLPSPNPIAYTPTCVGASDGMIIGNAIPLTGKPPFNWRIVSPYTSPVQASDTFRNLSSGIYMIRVEDVCGNFQSRTVYLIDDGTGFSNMGGGGVTKIGCDTFTIGVNYSMLKHKARLPVKLILTTSTGTTIKRVYPIPLDTVNYTPGLYATRDTITGVEHGSYLSICIEDTCGTRLCAWNDTISPFEFVMQYITTLTCANTVSAQISLKNPPYFPYLYTAYHSPLKMTLTDIASNTIVDSMTCQHSYCTIVTKEHVSGRSYRLRMEDGCGQIFQQNIVWPTPGSPMVNTFSSPACLDSTAYVYFGILNFRSNTKLEIISGPTEVKSTKPHYAFSDIITYPKTFNVDGGYFMLKNVTAGTYQYRVYDDCGNVRTGTFVVLPSMLADFNYSYTVKKGCLGNNIFTYNVRNTSIMGIYLRDIHTNNVMYYKSYINGPDSITSLPPGNYLFQIYYGFDPNLGSGILYNGYLTDHSADCWLMQDTITIPYYSNNMFKTSTSIFCNGNNYVQLLVDSTSGMAPYLYEIINGPQTYHPQSSNIFSIPSFGNYTIRIQDACGNSNTKRISIDSSRFPPVVKRGPSCLGSKIVLSGISSPFFQYEWRSPGGAVHYGDSLVISPLTAADTGVYLVKKTVTINGCNDSFNSSYHVYLHDVVTQTVNLCHSSSVRVGTNVYTVPGVYLDSLINSRGCDSIVSTTLVINYKRTSIDTTICEGNSIIVGTHYYTQTGIYDTDTLVADNGCDSLVSLNLTVLPYKRATIQKTICLGSGFYFAGQMRSIAGIYNDTLTTTGCDSIVTLQLSIEIPPVINLGADTSICEEPMYTLDVGPGFAAYYWNDNFIDTTRQTIQVGTIGKYWVSIKTFAGCTASDTIEILTVYPLPVVSGGNDEYICSGATATLSASTPTGIQYKWIPGNQTSSSITVGPEVTTIYKVTVTDINRCVSHQDEVMVFVNPSPTTFPFNQPKMTYCFDDGPLMLSAQGEKYFVWSNGDTTRGIEVKEEGLYSVTVSDDSGCFIKGEIQVKAYCPPELYFPSAFTPNGDNLHDDLEIFGKHFKNFEIKIFNRWGEIIFISNDRNLRWDGTYRGQEMPSGTYECIVQYQGEYEEDKAAKTLKGSVTLIR